MLAIMDYVVMYNIYIGAQHKKIAKIALDAVSIISVKIMLIIGDVVVLLQVRNNLPKHHRNMLSMIFHSCCSYSDSMFDMCIGR